MRGYEALYKRTWMHMSTGVDMTTQEKLIDGLQKAFPDESQAALARRAGLSVQRFNNYVTGIRTMDVDAVIGCAQALGWDIRKIVAEHEMETAPTPRVKALWRKLAATATLLLVGVMSMQPRPAQAAEQAFDAPHPVCIMRNEKFCEATPMDLDVARLLLASASTQGNGTPGMSEIDPTERTELTALGPVLVSRVATCGHPRATACSPRTWPGGP